MFSLTKRPPPGQGHKHNTTNKAHDLPLTIRSAELLREIHTQRDSKTYKGYKEDSSGEKQRHRAQEQPTGYGITKTPGSGSGSGSGVLSNNLLNRSNQLIHSITPQVAVPLNSSFSDKFFVFRFECITRCVTCFPVFSARVSTTKEKTPRGTRDTFDHFLPSSFAICHKAPWHPLSDLATQLI